MANRYWVGGTGTWSTSSTTNWSASSGGPSGASVPTSADSVFFDQAATYTVTMTGALNCLDITVSAGTVTFATGTTPTLSVAGNWSTIAGTAWNSTGAVTFTATTSKTITSGGITINAPFTFNGVAGTWTLQDNLTFGPTITTTLTSGTLALDSFTLSTGIFASSASTARTLNFGTGKILLTSSSTSTIWNTATVTNLTVSGTPLVECAGGGSQTITRTINTGTVSEANAISFSFVETQAGQGRTYFFTSGNVIKNLTVNGNQTIGNTPLTIYGSFTHSTANGTTAFTAGTGAWTFAATSGMQPITNVAGFTYDFPWTFGSATSTATWTLANNLTLGATRQLTLTNGTFDFNSKTVSAAGITILTGTPSILNTGSTSLTTALPITHTSGTFTLPFPLTITATTGYTFTAGTLALGIHTLTTPTFSSSNSNSRILNFATGKIVLNIASIATIWNTATTTGLTVLGLPTVECLGGGTAVTKTINSGALSEANAISFGLLETTGTVTYAFTASNAVKNLVINGLQTVSNIAITIYGSFTHSTANGTTTFTAGTNAWTFAGTSGTKTITTPAVTYDFPWTFNGTGSTWKPQNNITLGSTRAFTLTNGTFDFNNFSVTGPTTGITMLTGSATIANTGGTLSLPLITHTSGTLTLGTNLTITSAAGYTLPAGTLALGSNTLTTPVFNSSGTTARTLNFGTGKIVLNGSSTATVWNTATVTSLTVSGTPLVECQGGGTAVTKTISTGALSEANSISFSLLETTGTVTYTFTANNIVDHLIINGSQTVTSTALTIYGSFTHQTTNGTTTFTGGASAWTFGATSGSYTITNIAGFTYDFPWIFGGSAASTATWTLANNLTLGATRQLTLTNGTIDFNSKTVSAAGITVLTGSPTVSNLSTSLAITHSSGTLTLGSAAITGAYTHSAGTLSLSSFTLTAPTLWSASGAARTLNFGTGQLVLTGNNTTLFDVSSATNLTTAGTVYINSTYTGATGTRTFVTAFTEAQSSGYNVKTSGSSGIVIGTTATDTVALTGSYGDFDLTGLTNTLSNTVRTIYGNFILPAATGTLTAGASATTFSGTVTKTITSNGRTVDFPLTVSKTSASLQLGDALTLAATRTFTLTSGTFDLNTFLLTTPIFSSSGSTARTLAFGTSGTSQIALTGNGATIFDVTTATNFTTTGTVYINSTYTGATGTRTFVTGFTEAQAAGYDVKPSGSSGIVIGTTATDTVALTGNYNNFDLTGLTNTLSNTARTVYGNFIVPSTGGTLTAGASATTFSGAGTESMTTNGRTIPFPITINSTGTLRLDDALTLSNTLTTTLTAGNLDLNGFILSTGFFSSTGSTTRSILFNGSQIELTGNNGTVVDIGDAANFSWTGTPYFNCTYSGAVGTRSINIATSISSRWGLFATESNTWDFATTGNSGIVVRGANDIVNPGGRFNNFDLTGMTFTLNPNARTIFGNFIIPATGGTLTSTGASVNATTLSGSSGTSTITTNGRTYPVPLIIDGAGKTFRQNDATTLSQVLVLNAGTLDLNNLTFTAPSFESSGSGVRSISFGTSGQLTLTISTGTGSPIIMGTATNFSWTGTAKIFLSYSGGTGSRIINLGAPAPGSTTFPEQYAFDIVFSSTPQDNAITIAPSTDGLQIYGSVRNLNFTGSTNSITNPNSYNRYILGNLTVPAGATPSIVDAVATTFLGSSGTSTITSNGRLLDFPITLNCAGKTISQTDATSLTRALTLTAGTLDLNNLTFQATALSSSGTGVRSISFGTSSQLTLTGNAATVIDISTGTNFSWTGTPKIVSSYTGATGTRTFSIGSTAAISSAYLFDVNVYGTATSGINLSTTATDIVALTGMFKNVDFRGTSGSGFTGTLSNTARSIFGNFSTPSAGGTYTAGTTAMTFATTSTQTITTNGRTLDFPITINNTGTTTLAGGLTVGTTRAFTMTAGNLDLNGYTLTTGTVLDSVSPSNITFNGGTIACTASGTAWNMAGTALTTTRGTINSSGTISLTSASAKTFAGNGRTYYAKLNQGGAGTLSVTGANTFDNISSTAGVANTITFTTGATNNFVNFSLTGAAGALVTLNSGTAGTRATLNFVGTARPQGDYLNVKDINFTPYVTTGASPVVWYVGANSTNSGNNQGAAFMESGRKMYVLASGTSWVMPADFDISNNTVHIIGAGGGGAGSIRNSTTARAAGAGGGGGGYSKITNLSGSIGTAFSYSIGAAGSAGVAGTTSSTGGNGGSTTFNSVVAGGGLGGSVTLSASTGGTGGTGTLFNGGTGGGGAVSPANTTNLTGGGGGGGAAGPNGAGGNGGIGFTTTTTTANSGGGGGGNGGGTNGGNGAATLGGAGGNNSSGAGGGASNTAGTFGGGGGGAVGAAVVGKSGGAGIDIEKTIGGGGGTSGATQATNTATPALYGAGGGGAGTNATTGTANGASGAQGIVVIAYNIKLANTSPMLSLFR